MHWMLLLPVGTLMWGLAVSFAGYVAVWTDRARPAQLGRRELAILARESGIRAVALWLAPLGWWPQGPRHRPAREGVVPTSQPVLLVADYGQNASSTTFLKTFLRRRGFEWVWAVSGGRGTLSDRAAQLGIQVERLRRTTGADSIDIVGHGVGGLVAAQLIQDPKQAAHVRRLISLGTPWRGTRMAVFASQHPGPEILYGSHTLEPLSPPPVPTVCIWSPDDPLVVPASSGAIEGADEVRIDGAGHMDMLASPRSFRAVQAALTTPLAEPA